MSPWHQVVNLAKEAAATKKVMEEEAAAGEARIKAAQATAKAGNNQKEADTQEAPIKENKEHQL